MQNTETWTDGQITVTVETGFVNADLYMGIITDDRWPGNHAWFSTPDLIFIMYPGTDHWVSHVWDDAPVPVDQIGSVIATVVALWNANQVNPGG